MAWEVQHETIADGWVNTWTVEDESGDWVPQVYDTKEEAEAELTEFLKEIDLEIARGERQADQGYDRSEFCVVNVGEGLGSDQINSQTEKE